MKKGQQFKEGDKVFAKVKGYPAWPAEVVAKSGKKFSVQFYGTGERGFVKPEELFYYNKNKEQMVKGSKKKEFKDAIEEIEKVIAQAGGEDGDDGTGEVITPASKRKRSNSEKSNDSQPPKKGNRGKSPESDRDSVSMSSENVSVNGPVTGEDEVSTKVEAESENEGEGEEDEENEDEEEEDEGDYMDDGEGDNTADGDMPLSSDIKIVSEQDLKNWIIYADYVKENPELYKAKTADDRGYTQTQCHAVLLPTGSYAGIKLHKSWPVSFPNEYENSMYDYDVASRVLLLKEALKKDETSPEDDPDSFVAEFNLSEPEVKREIEMKLINTKYRRVERLRNESKMIELDAKIKNSLALSKADPKKALTMLETLNDLSIDLVTLKKHSHVVDMIRRLRKYIGNTDEWNLSEEELDIFIKDAQKVREKAEVVYQKFKDIVKLPAEVTNFWDAFSTVVTKFKEDCRGLTNREVFTLCDEPFSRAAIIDRLEQSEELEEAEGGAPGDNETEKENSSEIANSETKPIITPASAAADE